MPIVERIWMPTQKDIQSGLRQSRAFGSSFQNAASTVLTATFAAVPADTCRVLTNISMNGTPGAAQRAYAGFANVYPPGGVNALYQLSFYPDLSAPVGAFFAMGWQGEVILLPGEVLELDAVFSGAVANNCSMSWFGYDIPRANIV